MKRIFAILALALFVTGCAGTWGERLGMTATSGFLGSAAKSIVTSAEAATVNPQTIIVAASTFDAIEVTAKNYLRLPRCTGANGPACRSRAATRPLIAAVRAGIKARRAAVAFVRTHPGQLGPSGLYDGLNAAIAAIQNIFRNYNVEAVAPR